MMIQPGPGEKSLSEEVLWQPFRLSWLRQSLCQVSDKEGEKYILLNQGEGIFYGAVASHTIHYMFLLNVR